MVLSFSGNLATGITFGELSVSTASSFELSDFYDLLSSSLSLSYDTTPFLLFLAFIIIYFIVSNLYISYGFVKYILGYIVIIYFIDILQSIHKGSCLIIFLKYWHPFDKNQFKNQAYVKNSIIIRNKLENK